LLAAPVLLQSEKSDWSKVDLLLRPISRHDVHARTPFFVLAVFGRQHAVGKPRFEDLLDLIAVGSVCEATSENIKLSAKFVAPYLEYRVRVSRSRRGQAKSKT